MVYKLLVCVIHSKKLALRMPTLQPTLNKLQDMLGYDVKVEVIDKHDPEDIDVNVIREKIVLENPKSNTIFDQLVRNIHVKHVSQSLKHHEAFDKFVKDQSFNALLVLEDDVLATPSIASDLNAAVQLIKSNDNIEVLCLGAPTPKSSSNNKFISMFEHFRFLPSVDSYLVTRKGAEKIHPNFFPIRYQTNVHLSFLCMKHNVNIVLNVPNIFVNGSKLGVFLSSVDPNNRLFMNQDFNKLVAINAKTIVDNRDVLDVEDLIKSGSFKEHPDFQHQLGVFYSKVKNYEKAKEFYDKAYKTFIENDCLLNNESEFLLNYTRVFQHFQST